MTLRRQSKRFPLRTKLCLLPNLKELCSLLKLLVNKRLMRGRPRNSGPPLFYGRLYGIPYHRAGDSDTERIGACPSDIPRGLEAEAEDGGAVGEDIDSGMETEAKRLVRRLFRCREMHYLYSAETIHIHRSLSAVEKNFIS